MASSLVGSAERHSEREGMNLIRGCLQEEDAGEGGKEKILWEAVWGGFYSGVWWRINRKRPSIILRFRFSCPYIQKIRFSARWSLSYRRSTFGLDRSRGAKWPPLFGPPDDVILDEPCLNSVIALITVYHKRSKDDPSPVDTRCG